MVVAVNTIRAAAGSRNAGGFSKERTLGSRGGSVEIQKENGRIHEERTYPGSR
jgi:hypothetical protein